MHATAYTTFPYDMQGKANVHEICMYFVHTSYKIRDKQPDAQTVIWRTVWASAGTMTWPEREVRNR
jgi:hypothetical protein